jgi:hypothetical protein
MKYPFLAAAQSQKLGFNLSIAENESRGILGAFARTNLFPGKAGPFVPLIRTPKFAKVLFSVARIAFYSIRHALWVNPCGQVLKECGGQPPTDKLQAMNNQWRRSGS